MTFDVLSDSIRADVQALSGLYDLVAGQTAPLFVPMPPELGIASGFDFGVASVLADQVSDQGLASSPVTAAGDFGLASDPPTSVPCRFAEDQLDVEQFAQHLFATRSLALLTVRV